MIYYIALAHRWDEVNGDETRLAYAGIDEEKVTEQARNYWNNRGQKFGVQVLRFTDGDWLADWETEEDKLPNYEQVAYFPSCRHMDSEKPPTEPLHCERRDQEYMLGWEILQIHERGKGVFGYAAGVRISLPPWLKTKCKDAAHEIKECKEEPELEHLAPIEAAIRKKMLEEVLQCVHEWEPGDYEGLPLTYVDTCMHCDEGVHMPNEGVCPARVKKLLTQRVTA